MLVLASQSATRCKMLGDAGLKIEALPAYIDEDAIKQALQAEGASVSRAAETLAELKAQKIADQLPKSDDPVFVIGADQLLVCGAVWFDKPPDLDHARAQLVSLAGKTHSLVSSVVLLKDGERIWHATQTANMTMRDLSDDFIDAYISDVGDEVLSSVGSYQLEGRGAQLFKEVDGDFFTVLGLPLLPLLDILRVHGVLKT